MSLAFDQVLEGDWLELAAGLLPGSVDLLYADPPFNTGRTQRARAGAFEDRWASPDELVAWVRTRLEHTLPALSPSACVLLHLDWRTSHRARVMLDDLLSEDHFVNHLIWSYGLGGSSPRRFARKHDDILFYAVDPAAYYFDAPMVASTSQRMQGRPKKATDVLSIPSINNMAKERTGWPTQKPLALLDLLIGACCPPGGAVLDPCCGSGTTLVSARRSGRSFLGFDIDTHAVTLARRRLDEDHHAPA